jgi:RimJ/RimL family protein N-acetyltransferase
VTDAPAPPPGLPALPSDEEQALRTARLDLIAILPEHATLLFPVLDDQALYDFMGGKPPEGVEALAATYAKREARRSPDGTQLWLNWMLRRRDDGDVVGFAQASVQAEHGEVAWVVGTASQGQGFASEAAAALVPWLFDTLGVPEVRACVHPDHEASQRVAHRAGLRRTDELDDGEEVWVCRPT